MSASDCVGAPVCTSCVSDDVMMRRQIGLKDLRKEQLSSIVSDCNTKCTKLTLSRGGGKKVLGVQRLQVPVVPSCVFKPLGEEKASFTLLEIWCDVTHLYQLIKHLYYFFMNEIVAV